MTLNLPAQGSNPCRPTNQSGAYKVKVVNAFFIVHIEGRLITFSGYYFDLKVGRSVNHF